MEWTDDSLRVWGCRADGAGDDGGDGDTWRTAAIISI